MRSQKAKGFLFPTPEKEEVQNSDLPQATGLLYWVTLMRSLNLSGLGFLFIKRIEVCPGGLVERRPAGHSAPEGQAEPCGWRTVVSIVKSRNLGAAQSLPLGSQVWAGDGGYLHTPWGSPISTPRQARRGDPRTLLSLSRLELGTGSDRSKRAPELCALVQQQRGTVGWVTAVTIIRSICGTLSSL